MVVICDLCSYLIKNFLSRQLSSKKPINFVYNLIVNIKLAFEGAKPKY